MIEALIDSESDEVQSVGRYFKAIIQNSILELAFSDGDVAGLSYEERVTVLEVADLSLPKDGSDHISDHESNSIALMFALGAFVSILVSVVMMKQLKFLMRLGFSCSHQKEKLLLNLCAVLVALSIMC